MTAKRLLTLIVGVCLILVLAALPFMTACAAPPEKAEPIPTTEPIVLKAVNFVPPTLPLAKLWLHFFEMVEEKTDGRVVIDYLGAGEVISMRDAPIALLEGKFDIICSAGGLCVSLAPGAYGFELSGLSAEEERDIGFFDLTREAYKEGGFFFIGRGAPSIGPRQHNLWTTKPVTCLDDLKGMKVVTVMIILKEALQKFGMTLTPVASAELYTALERGVCDAYIGNMAGLIPRSLDEVLTCCIDHPFLSQGMTTLMSLEGWSQIPEDLQDKILEVQREWEIWGEGEVLKEMEEHRQILEAEGIQFIKFSPDEAEEFVSAFYEEGWKVVDEVDPEYAAKFREMLGEPPPWQSK